MREPDARLGLVLVLAALAARAEGVDATLRQQFLVGQEVRLVRSPVRVVPLHAPIVAGRAARHNPDRLPESPPPVTP